VPILFAAPQEHPLIIGLDADRLAIERERHSLFLEKAYADQAGLL
jgi:hypothetical protein